MNKNEEMIKKQKLLEKYFGSDKYAYSQFVNTKEYKEILKLSYDTIFARTAFLRAFTPNNSKLMLKDIVFILQKEKGSGKQVKKSVIKEVAKDMALEHIKNLTESELNEFTPEERNILISVKESGKFNNSELDKILKILYSPLISDKESTIDKIIPVLELPEETRALTIEEVSKLFDELIVSIDSQTRGPRPNEGSGGGTGKGKLKEEFLGGVQTILKRGDIKITGVKKSRSNVIYACFEPIVKDADVLRYTIFEGIAQAGNATYFVPNVLFEELEKNMAEEGNLPRLDIMKTKGFSKNHKLESGKYDINWFNSLIDGFFKTVNNKADFNFENLIEFLTSEISQEEIGEYPENTPIFEAAQKSSRDQTFGFRFNEIEKAIQEYKITSKEFANNSANRTLIAEMLLKEFQKTEYARREAKKISNILKNNRGGQEH